MTESQQIEAVFAGGVLKPIAATELREGELVLIEVHRRSKPDPDVVLAKARAVYEGLTLQEIDEIERDIQRRPLFGQGR